MRLQASSSSKEPHPNSLTKPLPATPLVSISHHHRQTMMEDYNFYGTTWRQTRRRRQRWNIRQLWIIIAGSGVSGEWLTVCLCLRVLVWECLCVCVSQRKWWLMRKRTLRRTRCRWTDDRRWRDERVGGREGAERRSAPHNCHSGKWWLNADTDNSRHLLSVSFISLRRIDWWCARS